MPSVQHLFGGQETGYGGLFNKALRNSRSKQNKGLRGLTDENIKSGIGRNGREVPGGSQGDYQTKKSNTMTEIIVLPAAPPAAAGFLFFQTIRYICGTGTHIGPVFAV